ncbi:MAG: AAA family ATPase [Actinobacteria bacterium]|nr:AAA family ATPase [Actinomycetota bacterium]
MAVEFRVLGAIEVVADGQAAAVGGSRERAVLARLLVSPNQVVAQDTLIDDLWPGDQSEGGAAAVQVYVSRLRKALRSVGGDDVLLTRPPGYLLAVAAEALDATRFEALVRAGRQAAANGKHAEAAATLTDALALWRGPAFPGLADLPFARAEAARLEEARLGALEARIDADLVCGRDAELIGELASLTAEHPLRERLWALRMTALYRAGRQAEALRTYQELRRHLGEELGIEPSEDLRALEGAILRQDPQLARRPEPVAAPNPGPGVVTFMFTDLVGSTELLDRLGDDAADDLRRQHFSSLRQALRAHGGAEVKSMGDGLMAAFTSPLAALRCAVEIQRDNAAGADGSEAISIRVGLHAGEPIAEDDDFFGTPVVVAQRLCGRAGGGQILISTLVEGLVGNRADCTFVPLGDLLLKGFGEPIAASEVRWRTPETEPALPLPQSLPPHDRFFVRPENDMGRLETAWEAARSGRRQMVLLAGEPGIGKTRRSAELARTAHEGGAAVLHGRCEEGLGVPYQPFVEAFGTYLRHAPSPVLGRLAGELVRLVPELATRFPDLPPPLSADPETERYRLFDAVAAWLAAVADETPVVLLIEDLHWATPPTLAMLGHLARSGEPGRLLVVVNYRDTALDVTPALSDAVADLLRQPDVDRLRLAGLEPDGVVAYLEARAGHGLDDEGRALAGVLHTETAGNPFYLTEVLRHLGETGALSRREGRWAGTGAAADVEVPDSVRDVIGRRLARLPAETADLLALAAVQGDRFDLAVLTAAAGQPYTSVLRALDPATSARFVTEPAGEPPTARFVHALLRQTVEDGLPAGRRMELHHATGDALASLVGVGWADHAAELARHWLAAMPPVGASVDDLRRTLDYTEEAARRAATALAYEEAATLLTRAAPLAARLGDPGRRAAVLVALGEAQHNAGDGAHRRSLLEAANLALELGDGQLAAHAALANQRPISITGAVDEERVALFERVLEALGPADTSDRARMLGAMATELHPGTDPRRYDLAREALAVARRVGDPACLGHVLAYAAFALWEAETLPERLEIATELSQLAGQLGDPMLQLHAGLALYYAAAQSGDLDQARSALSSATEMAEALGQPALRIRAIWAQQSCALLEGRFADFRTYASMAFHFGEALGNADSQAVYHGDGGTPDLLEGRPDEAAIAFAKGAELIPHSALKIAYAYASAEAGRLAEAATVIDGVGGATLQGVPHDYTWVLCLAALAGACGPLGDRDLARRLYDELLPYRTQMITGQVSAFGPVAYYLGVLAATLGRPDEAEDHFAFACDLMERTGAHGLLVKTRLDWARLLLGSHAPDDADRARELAIAALDLAHELDTPELAKQASELLTTGRRRL